MTVRCAAHYARATLNHFSFVFRQTFTRGSTILRTQIMDYWSNRSVDSFLVIAEREKERAEREGERGREREREKERGGGGGRERERETEVPSPKQCRSWRWDPKFPLPVWQPPSQCSAENLSMKFTLPLHLPLLARIVSPFTSFSNGSGFALYSPPLSHRSSWRSRSAKRGCYYCNLHLCQSERQCDPRNEGNDWFTKNLERVCCLSDHEQKKG